MEENSTATNTISSLSHNNKNEKNTPTNPSNVQKRISALNKTGNTNNINNNNNNSNALFRPSSVASYRTSNRNATSGIPAKRTSPKKPLLPLSKSSTTVPGEKAAIPMTVMATSSAARRVAASRISSSKIQTPTLAKKPVSVTNVKSSITSASKRTTTVSRPAPPLAIRTTNVKTTKESSIPQASKRITVTSTTRKTKEKVVKPNVTKLKDNENEPVADHTVTDDVNKSEIEGGVHKCRGCGDDEDCVCQKEDGQSDSDASSIDSKKKTGSSTLKKTKSTRTPQRHATYVSELNKDIRKKFQQQRAERQDKADAKKTTQQPKVAPKPTKASAAKKRSDLELQKKMASPGRIVHCPVHSKFANQLSSKFIKARCIPECPHFNEVPATRNRSDSHSSGVSNDSSIISSPAIRKKRPGATTTVRSTGAKSAVPYVITTNNSKKTVTTRRTGPGNATNVRVRSAPSSQGRVTSTVKKPVQSYLVRNGMIPNPQSKSQIPSHTIPAKPKKVRQKSFKLSRTKSKSFKYKNKPFVSSSNALAKKTQKTNNTEMVKATRKTVVSCASVNTTTKAATDISALESDDNYSTTDFDTETDNMLSTSDGGLSSSEDTLYQQHKPKVSKVKKASRQKSLRLGRAKSRSKSFRTKSKAKPASLSSTTATTAKTKTRRRLSSKKSDSLLSEDSLQFEDDSLGANSTGGALSLNELNLNFDDLEFGDEFDENFPDGELFKGNGPFDENEDGSAEEGLEFETDEELVAYYFELFKKEFPQIVEQASLTKEEMVSVCTQSIISTLFKCVAVNCFVLKKKS